MRNNAINILITAGGTSEKIDSVRRISNMGTGKLGALIADAYFSRGENDYGQPGGTYTGTEDIRIVYICSSGAVRPGVSRSVEIIVADDVAAVEAAIRAVCLKTPFDIIIHSMAISDYVVRAVSDSERMADDILGRLSLLACGDSASPEEAVREALISPPALPGEVTGSKISSEKEDLIIVLEKAPKLIAMLRGLAKDAVIVGFKLLSDVSEEELIKAGQGLLKKHSCDFVLANDMKSVVSGKHEGLLIGKDGSYERASGKEAIAELVVNATMGMIRT